MMKKQIQSILITLMIVGAFTTAHADVKQAIYDKAVVGTQRVSEELHDTLVLAKEIGFYVDEIRFEISLTPKIEVYFRDKGDTGHLKEVLSKSNKVQEGVLRLLQSTRKFNVAHYSPTGVKLITGVAKPSVEILSTWQE